MFALKTSNIRYLENDIFTPYRVMAWVVILAYIIIYFGFLYKTNFLPYVFDNNETFSSLVHAQNLYNFGVRDSFGLTDEAYGLLKSAHPYVYTHQGNFPRFYSLLLYYLGAQSAESQIFIATFTIGLAGMVLCYHYFAKYVSCLFAAIFCLLLMTDYIMFMQWQVNIWRVWHLFFFFSSFLCCHGLSSRWSKTFILVSMLNFACLFYMEIVYAMFTLISSLAYIILFNKSSFAKKILNSFILSSGALIGMGILICQNIAYLGLERFLLDLSYTFTSRNQLFASQLTVDQIMQFYAVNKIVFWDNFNFDGRIRNPLVILYNFYSYCLLPYSPFLTISALSVLLGSGLSYLSYWLGGKQYLIKNYGNRLTVKKNWKAALVISLFITCLLAVVSMAVPGLRVTSVFIKHKLLIYNMLIILMGIFLYFIYQPVTTQSLRIKLINNFHCLGLNLNTIVKWLFLLVATMSYLYSVYYVTRTLYPINWSPNQISQVVFSPLSLTGFIILGLLFLRLMLTDITLIPTIKSKLQAINNTVFILVFIVIIARIAMMIHNQESYISRYLQEFIVWNFGGTSLIPLILGSILLINAPININTSTLLKFNSNHTLQKIFPFSLATFVGFICTYLIFPGYVITGYWQRYCCFTVFFHMVLYAWLFYVISVTILNFYMNTTKKSTALPINMKQKHLKLIIAFFLLFIFTQLWINLQKFYIKEFSPSNFNFVNLLKTQPIHNKSIVSNTYSAPFYFLGQLWAYCDPTFGYLEFKQQQHISQRFNNLWLEKQPSINQELNALQVGRQYKRDLKYLWFADAFNNLRYFDLDIFICWKPYFSLGFLGYYPKSTCNDIPIVRMARDPRYQDLGLQEIYHDTSGRDHWSIITLAKESNNAILYSSIQNK